MRIAQDLYFYPWDSQEENNCNSVFLDGKVPTLIDPGHRKHLPRLLNLMEKDGLRRENIALIINTHAHPDHMESCMEFANKDVLITMHEEEETFIKEIGPRYFAAVGMQPPSFKVDFYLTEGDLQLGHMPIKVFHTPGHSPGSISLLLVPYKLLISGDLIFFGSVGRVDIPGGDPVSLKQSISRMSQMDIEYIIPGHGPIIPDGQTVRRNFAEIERMVNYMI